MEKRVLLVDADPTFAEGVARDLGRAGIIVSVVADDGAAVERARAERPDAILLSELAERNVFASCNRVRRTPGLTEIPVVVLSESATPSAIEAHRASRTPAALYLRKPMDGPALARALRPLLESGMDHDARATDSLDVEEIGAEDVIEDVDPIDDEAALAPSVGPPPPLELPPDPLAESASETRGAMGSSPEERVQFLRERLRARDEQVQRARIAWTARERELTTLHAHASRLFEALGAQQAALVERDETVAELERSVLAARREHEQMRQAEVQLREQLEDAEGRARSLSEILNDTLQQREEGDRGWSARLAEVEAAAGELKTELDGLRAAREQLDEALKRAASELRQARDELDSAASREAALQQDLDDLRSSSAIREDQLQNELDSERTRLETELIQVRGDLENEVAGVRGELSARIAELSGELSATRDEAGDRSLELEEARGQLDDLSARLSDATRRAEEMERLAAQRATRIEGIEAEADATRTELLAARARIESRERELADLRTSAGARVKAIEADLDERLAAAARDLESAVAGERADAEARIAETERAAAEARAQREEEMEAELAQAAALLADTGASAAEQQGELRQQADAKLAEVRAATRADLEARMAQVNAAATARVHALEQELERREARFADQLAVARGEAQVLAAEASGEAEGRIAAIDARLADMMRRHDQDLAAVRSQAGERERELVQRAQLRERELQSEMEHRLAQAREEADEAIAHARSEIEDRLAGAETDADDRIAVLERNLHEERGHHERELAAARERAKAAAGETGSFSRLDEPSGDAAALRAASEQLQALEAQVKAAVEQAARFRADRDRAAAAYEKAREEAVRLRRQQPGGAELEQLRRELREVRASRERLQDELASQIADLVTQLSRRETELAAARRGGGDTPSAPDLQAALHRVELLERDRTRILGERDGLEDQFRRQLEQVTSAGDAAVIHALRRRVAELQDQLQGSASRGRLDQLETELEELRGENEFLSSEVARYADKMAALSGKGPTPIARIKR